MKMQSRKRLAVGAIAVVVSVGGAAPAAPLLPATLSIASTTLNDVTPVRWRGGGAGLATVTPPSPQSRGAYEHVEHSP